MKKRHHGYTGSSNGCPLNSGSSVYIHSKYYNCKQSKPIETNPSEKYRYRRPTERATNPEKVFGGSGVNGAVLDFGLLGEVVGGVDRRQHSLDGEERGKICRVRRDDDEREKPPRAADDSPC